MPQPIKITLEVDINKLSLSKGRPSRNSVVKACKLSDNNNGKAIGSGCLLFFVPAKRVKNFTTAVGPTSEIVWEGKSTDSNYKVIIDSIVYRYGRHSINFFDAIVLKPTTPGLTIVKHNIQAGNTKDEYEYIINFRIEHQGRSQDFQIDPRLKMHTSLAE